MPAPPDRVRALRGALDQLVVETIHAYCRRLLAAHPIEAGLHPRFEVDADGAAAAVAVREAVAEQLGAAYERGDETVLGLAHHGIGPSELEAELHAQRGAGVAAHELARDPLAPERIAALRARLAAAHEALEQAAAGRLALGGDAARPRNGAADALGSRAPRSRAPMRSADDLVRAARAPCSRPGRDPRAMRCRSGRRATFSQAERDAFGRARRCDRRRREAPALRCSRISRRSTRPCSRRSRPRSPRWPPTPRSACAAAGA